MLLFFFGYVPVCSEVCRKVIKRCWCVVSEKSPKRVFSDFREVI